MSDWPVFSCISLYEFAPSAGRNCAHNPKVVSSNLTPATMGACEENPLSALLIYVYELSRNNSFA